MTVVRAEISFILSDIHLDCLNTYCGTIWVHPGYNLSTIWVQSYGKLRYFLWQTCRIQLYFFGYPTVMLEYILWYILSTFWVHSEYVLSTSWVQSYGNLRYFLWQTSLTCRNQFIWENSHKIVPILDVLRMYPDCTKLCIQVVQVDI